MHSAFLSTLHRSLALPRSSFISSLHVAVSYDAHGLRRERLTVEIAGVATITPPFHPPPPLPLSFTPSLPVRPSPYSIRTLTPITPLVASPSPPLKPQPSIVQPTSPPPPSHDVDMAISPPSPPIPSSLSPPLPLYPSSPSLPSTPLTPPHPSTSSSSASSLLDASSQPSIHLSSPVIVTIPTTTSPPRVVPSSSSSPCPHPLTTPTTTPPCDAMSVACAAHEVSPVDISCASHGVSPIMTTLCSRMESSSCGATPTTPPPSTSHSARVSTAEKRDKEWSDEEHGAGSDRGSDKETEEKGATPDGSSGEDDYRQVKSKRQKLKEKKKRQKAKKAEAAALRHSSLVLPDELERERLWILDSLQPTPEAIDQALSGHPSAHPVLLRLLLSAESLISLHVDGDNSGRAYPAVTHLFRQLVLSPAPLTSEALNAAFNPIEHLH